MMEQIVKTATRSRNRQPRAKSERIERHQFYEDTVETETTDPMMEQIVKTATRAPTARKNPVERRKRSRNLQRKSREFKQACNYHHDYSRITSLARLNKHDIVAKQQQLMKGKVRRTLKNGLSEEEQRA